MNKIFYYDDESENLLKEEDAEDTSIEEVIDEVFELDDDDISYIGIITHDGDTFKIKSDHYDSYKIYKLDTTISDYQLVELGDWEKCKLYLEALF